MKIYAAKIIDISEEQIDRLCLLINLDKRHKIKKFINKNDKIRSLIGELLVRSIIKEELNVMNDDIFFQKNKFGKPYIKEYPKFNFNLSHSGDFVVCAIDNQPIGIDIEEIKDIEFEDISKNFFTSIEHDYIKKENSYIQINKFYDIWTLKESFVKCCGKGLSIPLKSFSINTNKQDNIRVFIENENKEYKFKSFDIELGYKMAVCSLNKEISNKIIRIDSSNLINSFSTKCVN